MAKYHISKKAVEDLSSIWKYTFETWSESQADHYYHELIKAFESIAEKPFLLDREYFDIHPGLFSRKCKKHLVFYRLDDLGEIEIIRILHERMDVSRKLQ